MPVLLIKNETSKLVSVVLGTALSMGDTPKLEDAYDPKSKEHIKNGTFPTEKDIAEEISEFKKALETNNIKVYRPESIENYNQIFTRDIGCVIENKFLITNMISERSREIEAIGHVLNQIPAENIHKAPLNARFEGGDVMPHNDYIFIGYSEEPDFSTYKVARTNKAGVDFIQSKFPEKIVKGFELSKSDTEPRENALHLDCCFQPFGLGHAIIHEQGFKNTEDFNWLLNLFGTENCLTLDKTEMYEMGCNLFSIDKNHVISDKRFKRINSWMKEKGYSVTEINYKETSKMEGLLRCSTLPLCRED